MVSKNSLEKDLGIKIGSKEEKAWKDIQDRVEKDLSNAQREIIINKRIIELCIEQRKKHKL